MRAKREGPAHGNVQSLAEQLQAQLDATAAKKRMADNSPEMAALKILREALFRTDQQQQQTPSQRSPMRAWMQVAKLGESAVFFGTTRTAFTLAAREFDKKVTVNGGVFICGASFERPTVLNRALMVTIIEDEHGNKLPDAGAESDGADAEHFEDGVQEESAGSAP